MIDKNAVPTKLLWVDLEMTGLDAARDVILEVAAIITDFDFQPLQTYQARVRQDPAVVTERFAANPWWNDYPANRDDFLNNLEQGQSLAEVEQELVALVSAQFGAEAAILAGNSIHADRQFVKQYWPALDAKLHYRMLDVSSFKIVMQGKYHEILPKPEIHRAVDDIQASIVELQHYLKWFQQPQP